MKMKPLMSIIKVLLPALVIALLLDGVRPRQAWADDRPVNPGLTQNTVELLLYESSGYRYQIIPLAAAPPRGFEQPAFDDSSFNTGVAPFGGGGGGLGTRDCPLRARVRTEWPTNSQLLIRRTFMVTPGATDVRLMVSVDNDIVAVFVNGTRVNSQPIVHDNCPIRDEFRFDAPGSIIKQGQNTVALQVADRAPIPGQNAETFFDMRILAEITTPQILTSLRSAAENADAMIPREPVVDVVTTCSDSSRAQLGDLANINFRVAKTGALGQITVSSTFPSPTGIAPPPVSPTRSNIRVDLALANEQLASGELSDTSLNINLTPRLANPSDQTIRQQMLPFDSVVSTSEFQSKIGACLAAPINASASSAQCASACNSRGRFVRGSIFLLTKVSLAAGLAGFLADEAIGWIASENVAIKACGCVKCCDAGIAAGICLDDSKRPGQFENGC
jgi:hypothetical protein